MLEDPNLENVSDSHDVTHSNQQNFKIFISHCTADSEIADILRTEMESWSNGNIPIFQSSSPRNATPAGGILKQDLAQALAEARTVIFLYTSPKRDWSYPIWECGVAFDPIHQDTTRIIVMEFTTRTLSVFSDLTRISVDEKGIKKFSWDFHKEKNFFPGQNDALYPNLSEEEISQRSSKLYEKLKKFVSDKEKQKEEIPRWDYLKIRLPRKTANEIKLAENTTEIFETSQSLLEAESRVSSDFGGAVRHFGYNQIYQEMTLGDLLTRWRNDSNGQFSTKWIDGVLQEMTRVILKREAKPTWELMRSMRPDVQWYLAPIINHVRKLPEEDCLEFDLYFYNVPVDEGGRMAIGLEQHQIAQKS